MSFVPRIFTNRTPDLARAAMPPPYQTKDVSLFDGVVRVEMAGTGPAILLLHGWTLDRRMWRPQLAALAARYRVISVDRRGFGESSAPPDLDRELHDVRAILHALQLDRCALVGMSQGGRIAQRFAHTHGDLLWALVLQSAPLDAPAVTAEIPLADYQALVRSGRLDEMRAAWRAHPLLQFPASADRSLLDAMLDAYDGRDLLAHTQPAASAPAARLAAIETPTLVLTGEFDPDLRQQAADTLHRILPHAVRAILPGAGHLANLSHPDAFNALLLAFLQPHAPRPDRLAP